MRILETPNVRGHGNQKQVVEEQDKSMSDLVKVKMVELQD